MFFVFIWEQTATCATYSINWLVFITEMKSVYCAVRTGALNKAVCVSSVKGQTTKFRGLLVLIPRQKQQRKGSVVLRGWECLVLWWTFMCPFKRCTNDVISNVSMAVKTCIMCCWIRDFNPLNPELNPICYLLAVLAHHFLHVSRIRVKSLTLRWLMSYIYGAPILDVSRSHTTTQHSR